MTLLGPLLFVMFYALVFGIVYYIANEKEDVVQIALVNNSSIITTFPDSMKGGGLLITQQTNYLDTALALLSRGEVDGVLQIKNKGLFENQELTFISNENIGVKTTDEIKESVKEYIDNKKQDMLHISASKLDSLNSKVLLLTKKYENKNITDNNTKVAGFVGMAFTFLTYFFVFAFAVQVMRGVMEEKSNRIVEVLVSVVRPFDLMMGKIIGIALVGFTQLFIWVLLTGIFALIGSVAMASLDISQIANTNMPPRAGLAGLMTQISPMLLSFTHLPWPKIFITFLLFFVGGYLLYSAIFAAIGSAIDAETDIQQFMLPITLPLILGLIIGQSIAFSSGNSTIAIVASMVPFTSPAVMVVRACLNAPWWQIIVSAILLYGTFILMVFITSKIYRIAILTFGKKPTWKQLFKWMLSKSI